MNNIGRNAAHYREPYIGMPIDLDDCDGMPDNTIDTTPTPGRPGTNPGMMPGTRPGTTPGGGQMDCPRHTSDSNGLCTDAALGNTL